MIRRGRLTRRGHQHRPTGPVGPLRRTPILPLAQPVLAAQSCGWGCAVSLKVRTTPSPSSYQSIAHRPATSRCIRRTAGGGASNACRRTIFIGVTWLTTTTVAPGGSSSPATGGRPPPPGGRRLADPDHRGPRLITQPVQGGQHPPRGGRDTLATRGRRHGILHPGGHLIWPALRRLGVAQGLPLPEVHLHPRVVDPDRRAGG